VAKKAKSIIFTTPAKIARKVKMARMEKNGVYGENRNFRHE
jgi:hypothetical protein